MPRIIGFIVFCCLLASGHASADVRQLQLQVERQEYGPATVTGETLLQQYPQAVGVQFLTAYAYQMNNQPIAAIKLYQSLIAERPDLPEPRNNLAMIYLAQGDYDRASQMLIDAINTHQSYATAYDNLSRIYKGLASEAYRRAVSESSEPANYNHRFELAALSELQSLPDAFDIEVDGDEPSLITTANLETLLIQRVQQWASAWSNKDFDAYTGFYSSRHRARFRSHADWVEHRRKRILRPGQIRVEVSDIKVRVNGNSRATVDFRQAFDSPQYSDRVVKRLAFNRIGETWKITEERVLSVL